LTSIEAQSRLSQYGPNALPEEKVNLWLKFLSYFWGPIAWMLEAAALISAVLGDWADFSIIVLLMLVNSGIGFWEEASASDAVDALKSKLEPKAQVLRDGNWQQMAAKNLVPGDIISLQLGAIIPADAVLLSDVTLNVDQSALTGESMPVTRHQADLVYSGTIVKRGEGEVVVTATGINTVLGKTAKLISQAGAASSFQKAFMRLVDYLIVIALVLVLLVFVVELVKANNAHLNLLEETLTLLRFMLVLVIASIPVAAPVVLSLCMAAGANDLSKKKAIVQRLESIDELAGMDILCSDKTGTLTENKLVLKVEKLWENATPQEAILYAALASNLKNPDDIDQMVLDALTDKGAIAPYTLVKYTPFDPVTKRTEAEVQGPDGKTFRVSKGAPQVIVPLTYNHDELAGPVKQLVLDLANRGLRSLEVARTDEEGRWHLVALFSMADQPFPGTQATIAELKRMEVSVKMITGDQVAIARSVAAELDLSTNIINANDLHAEAKIHPELVAKTIAEAGGFGEVYPEDKYLVVSSLQKQGHLVGMTGDGVNDAAALKQANCGIAVSDAVDAARAAAAVVLTAPGLGVIADAVRISRLIFTRMNAYLIYRVMSTVNVLFFTALSILFFNDYPVTSIMILLLALLNDAPLISIAYDYGPISATPVRSQVGPLVALSSMMGAIAVSESFLLNYLLRDVYAFETTLRQTCIFFNMAVGQVLSVYATRTIGGPFWSYKASPILITATWGSMLVSSLICIFGLFGLVTPMGWGLWASLSFYTLVWFLAIDIVKQWATPLIFKPGSLALSLGPSLKSLNNLGNSIVTKLRRLA
jgi:H+-transporting ATPase